MTSTSDGRPCEPVPPPEDVTVPAPISPASETVRTIDTTVLHERCDSCATPIASRRRKIRRRRFCSPRCRAIWHRARKAALQQEAADLLRRCAAIIDELAKSKG
jgi:endogenous inhibitor of DNA gyrase (YacG/DUF329 family)